MTKVQFDRIICFGGSVEHIFYLEDFAFQEGIPFFLTRSPDEIKSLSLSSECSLFVFPEGSPEIGIIQNLFQSGHAWWIWDKFPIESNVDAIQNWIHNQHGAGPFPLFIQNILYKVASCLIPDFKPQLAPVDQINLHNASHCVFCEAGSTPFNFKVEVFYNHEKMSSHPAFQALPSAFVADFWHELANQFLGRMNQSVQYDDFVPDIGVPKYMGFDINTMIEANELQNVRVLFEDASLNLSIAVSAFSKENKNDPNFQIQDTHLN